MDPQQARQELSLIRDMIEKTRREAAVSGQFFIVIGLISLIAMLVIGMLGKFRLEHLLLPVLLALIVVNGVLSYFIFARERKREKVTTYAKTIYLGIWATCGLSILMVAFLFPLTRVYSYDLVPMLISLIFGIAVFSTGVIFGERRIQWCGSIWWVGAVILAYSPPGMLTMYIMMALILLGWVLPGLILNRRYHNREKINGA
jgi:hypothetical protein